MRHKNGRAIFGVSFADIRSGDRARCNVTAVENKLCGMPKTIDLIYCGPQYGAPLKPDSLDEQTRKDYEDWLLNQNGEVTP